MDLDEGKLWVAATRIVVDGRTIDSDGKTDSGVRTLSLDSGTVELLGRYLDVLDEEREAFETGYLGGHGKLMRYEAGRPVHADSITRRFNRLVDKAGVRRIRLHDVRPAYATLLLGVGVQSKIVGDRKGPADMSVKFQINAVRPPLDRARPRGGRPGRRADPPSIEPVTAWMIRGLGGSGSRPRRSSDSAQCRFGRATRIDDLASA